MTKKFIKRKMPMLLAALIFAASTMAGASNITGFDQTSGTFNINPESMINHNGTNVGFRNYTDFQLSEGDIANLIFKYGIDNVSKFVNMVDNQININGIVNTMRDGNFYAGDAVFVSPKGLVVGQNGVLNVGSLSVYTPTTAGMKMLRDGVAAGNLTTTYKNEEVDLLDAMAWHGNAPIAINGKVLSRGDVNLVANQYAMSSTGNIVAGADFNGVIPASGAGDLFSQLVKTSKNSNVNIRTYDRANEGQKIGGININGKIQNLGNGDLVIQNRGSNGLTTGSTAQIVNSNGELHLVNSKGTMNVGGAVTNDGAALHLTNGPSAGKLTVTGTLTGNQGTRIYNRTASGANIGGKIVNTGKGLAITNEQGELVLAGDIQNTRANMNVTSQGTGLKLNGNINSSGEIMISNKGTNGTVLNGNITNSGNTYITEVGNLLTVNGNINNSNGAVVLAANGGNTGLVINENAKIQNNNKVQIINDGSKGMSINGTVENSGGTAIANWNGALNVGEKAVIKSTSNTGKINITNVGNGGLKLAEGSQVVGSGAEILIQNTGNGGFTANGTVRNTGDTYLQNTRGAMTVNGNVTVETPEDADRKVLLIANTGSGLAISNSANINGDNASIRVLNTGNNGLNMAGTINNKNGGGTALTNRAGDFTVTGTIANKKGNMNLTNVGNGGLTIENGAFVGSEDGELIVQNTGRRGLTVNGEIENTGDTTIYNKAGDLTLSSTATVTNNDGVLYISNAGNKLDVQNGAEVTGKGNTSKVYLLNTGAGGMNVDGTVKHSVGRTLITNKAGDLNIRGTVDNRGGYLGISNSGNGALNINEDATVQNTGLGRTVITNKGKEGMNIDGNVVSGGHVIATNRAGGMNITSNVTSTERNVVLTNTGDKDMVVSGTVRGNRVTAYSKGNDIVLGNTETKQIAINGLDKVTITTDDGSIKNAGVDTHIIRSGGNLYMHANNGSIGEDVDTSNITANNRDLTKSVNVYVNGRVKAFTTDKNNNSVINIASKGKDLKVDRIKADGKVILLTDKVVDEDGNVKTGSILNAGTELSEYANVKGTTVHMISSGSIGTKEKPLHFRQTDATKESNVLAVKDIYLHHRGEAANEDVNFGIIKSKEGSIEADIIRNGVVNNAVAPGNINITARKQGANLNVKNKSNNPNVIKDYFDAEDTDKE